MTTRSRTLELAREDRLALLRLARAALQAAVEDRAPAMEDPAGDAAILDAPAAAFVTLQEAGELRGCMGTLDPDRPLRESVAAAAVSAALHDPRFWPVEPDELSRITVEVTVIGPMVPLEDPLDFDPPDEGILVERAGRRALLLPQVARERGWNAETTLAAVCQKAGLPGDAWRAPDAEVFAFGAIQAIEGEEG